MPDCLEKADNTDRFTGVLDAIVAHKRDEIAQRRERRPLSALMAQAHPLSGFPFEAALRHDRAVHLITEIKPSSPSAGVLKAEFSLEPVLKAYNAYASAISVLTDEKYFGGSFERLKAVSEQSPHPTLCKDFVLDEYSVYEARLSGAAAVLLIVKILDDATLGRLHGLVRQLGMTPVVEVQNESELDRALAIGAQTLLINNRNLSTFDVSLDTTHQLSAALRQRLSPDSLRDIIVISASGIATRADIDALLPSAHCFLIGSSLMKQPMEALPCLLAELAGSP